MSILFGIGCDLCLFYLDMLIVDYVELFGFEVVVYEGCILFLWWCVGMMEGGLIVFLFYVDVVLVVEDEFECWMYVLFGGVIDDGYVWGCGVIDDKGVIIV